MDEETPSINAGGIYIASVLHVDHYDAPRNILAGGLSFSTEQNLVDFGNFQEGHQEILHHNECGKLTEGVNDHVDGSNTHYGKEEPKEDEENDGGMFIFSKEG